MHEEAVPPPAEAPSWVATLGPKGYETDFGYLTRAHPPIRREIVEPAGAPARGSKRAPYLPVQSGPKSR